MKVTQLTAIKEYMHKKQNKKQQLYPRVRKWIKPFKSNPNVQTYFRMPSAPPQPTPSVSAPAYKSVFILEVVSEIPHMEQGCVFSFQGLLHKEGDGVGVDTQVSKYHQVRRPILKVTDTETGQKKLIKCGPGRGGGWWVWVGGITHTHISPSLKGPGMFWYITS